MTNDPYVPGCTLQAALDQIGRREESDRAHGLIVFGISKDLSHWHEMNIRTGDQLWDYLEGCNEGELL